MSDLLQKALRSLDALALGPEIAAFFRREEVQEKICKAAEGGRPPVSAISAELLAEIPQLQEDASAKRRIGLLVAALLDAQGYEQDRSGVRFTDPLFTTGSTYRRKAGVANVKPMQLGLEAGEPVSLARRLADGLNAEEAKEVVAALKRRFPDIF